MKLQTIYKKTKTGATQEWSIEVEGNKYRTQSGQVGGVISTNEWTVCFGKNVGRANSTTDDEQALAEAVAKRTKKLESGYFEDINNINEQQYFEPMLASKWEDSKDKIQYPIYSQPKLDGIRCIVTKDGMFSRNGKPIISAPHIGESLNFLFESNPNLILDGELYADKFANDFNKIVSLVKRTKPTNDDLIESAKNIEYHIYDIPSVNETFDGRLEALNELVQYFPKCVKVLETHIANNEVEVMELYAGYVEKGYEGQILRLNGKYENKRSKFLLKHKSFQDSEFPILDICEGEGNKTGQVGYMVFEIEGKRFKSNVKCSWEEGAEILKSKNKLLGKSATIQYFNLTPDGIPRFPYVININREEYE
jgi:DNA ligase-1